MYLYVYFQASENMIQTSTTDSWNFFVNFPFALLLMEGTSVYTEESRLNLKRLVKFVLFLKNNWKILIDSNKLIRLASCAIFCGAIPSILMYRFGRKTKIVLVHTYLAENKLINFLKITEFK
jgi:hypothetical protein